MISSRFSFHILMCRITPFGHDPDIFGISPSTPTSSRARLFHSGRRSLPLAILEKLDLTRILHVPYRARTGNGSGHTFNAQCHNNGIALSSLVLGEISLVSAGKLGRMILAFSLKPADINRGILAQDGGISCPGPAQAPERRSG